MNTAESFEIAAYDHPFVGKPKTAKMHQGATVAEIVAAQGIDPKLLSTVHVILSRGVNSSVVPMDQWGKVRPKAGSHVLISPRVHGPVLPLLAAAALPAAAGYVAGTVFGLAVGTLAYSAVYAAVTIVGSLLVNALIPPPAEREQTKESPNFTITGQSNAENPYGIYPTVLGRHLMYPPKTAKGYTSGQGKTIYYTGRYTFGYGPVALESLRIGTTPITEFNDVEIEFLNVDRDYTLAKMPELASMVVGWRTGTEPMQLYPYDVVEDAYSIELRYGVRQVRLTRENSIQAQVDVSFNSLVLLTREGNRPVGVYVRVRYRPVGGTWVDLGNEGYSAATTTSIRFTRTINFPEPGTYEVELTRESENWPVEEISADSYWTAVRSIQSGLLPSHENISEVAVRIRASEQLNGPLDALNGVVQQLAPVWDGKAWSAPQPVRHPAWEYARALTGPMLANPVAETRLQLEDLRDWYVQEPHWTCDAVIDQKTTLADVLDMICGAGRARRTLRDLKYSIIRDGGAGPVVQQFSQRNSYGFEGVINFPRKVHGFRVRFISEHLDWQWDELVAYATGYDASNATEFETLTLSGVVQPIWENFGGNPWRLGRYHLAQAELRPESYTWKSDLDFLRSQMGNKVRLVHDVPLIGVGSGRIKALTMTGANEIVALTLDEDISVTAGNYRVIIRRADGEEVIFTATAPTGAGGQWIAVGTPDGFGVSAGDLVLIEETTVESMEVLIASVRPFGNMQATLTGVPAAPEVLQADQGQIPAYVPNISKIQPREVSAPAAPQILSENIEFETDPIVQAFWVGAILPQDHFATAVCLVVMTEVYSGEEVFRNDTGTQNIRAPIPGFGEYKLSIYSKRADGKLSQPLILLVSYEASVETPADVAGFKMQVLGDQAFLTWDEGENSVSRYHIKHSSNPSAGWNEAQDVELKAVGQNAIVPALPGAYFIKAISVFDRYSLNAAVVTSNTVNLQHFNVVETITAEPVFAGTYESHMTIVNDELVTFSKSDVFEWDDIFEVDDIFTEGGIPPMSYYELADVVDLGGVYTSRVSAELQGYGNLVSNDIYQWADLYEIRDIFGGIDDQWGLNVQISTTDDDPSGSPTWSEWSDLVVGDYQARGYRFRVRFRSGDPLISVALQSLAITVDMPDRIERGDDINCPTGGVTVSFVPPFKAKPVVLVDGQSLPTGARVLKTNVSRTGFDMAFQDSGGNPLAATFDYHAVGYGRDNT